MEILIVEDESILLDSLLDGLSSALPNYRFEGAGSVEESYPLIEGGIPLLIISDVRLPGKDGIDFYLETNQKYPEVKFILMSAYEVPKSLDPQKSKNLLHFIQKPFELDEIIEIVKKVMQSSEFFRTKEVPLVDVLQIINFAKRTVTIAVENDDKTGRIFIEKGQILHAECGDHNGLIALNLISGWEGGKVKVEEKQEIPARTIQKTFQQIMKIFFEDPGQPIPDKENATLETQADAPPPAGGAMPPLEPGNRALEVAPKTSAKDNPKPKKGERLEHMQNLRDLLKLSEDLSLVARADRESNVLEKSGVGDSQGLVASVYMSNQAIGDCCDSLGLDQLEGWLAVVGDTSIYVHMLEKGFVTAMGKKTKNPIKNLKLLAENF